MMPTVWSVLFDDDRLPTELAHRLRRSDEMEEVRRELRRFGDVTLGQVAEESIEDALRSALEIPLLEVLMPAWRQHPEWPAARQASRDAEGIVVLRIGEHEVCSTHQPRVDVEGRAGTLASFRVDLRIELRVQSATLRLEPLGAASSVRIGACSGTASLRLDGRALVDSAREDIRFPDHLRLEDGLGGDGDAGVTSTD